MDQGRERWASLSLFEVILYQWRRLGHPMEPDALEREMARYRLPPGILPWLRHRSHYWDRGERTTRWLRERGIVPANPSDRAGLPPRSLPEAVREALLPQWRV